jgi:hypothetical protein
MIKRRSKRGIIVLVLFMFGDKSMSYAADAVTSSCAWKPNDINILADLKTEKIPANCTASRPD